LLTFADGGVQATEAQNAYDDAKSRLDESAEMYSRLLVPVMKAAGEVQPEDIVKVFRCLEHPEEQRQIHDLRVTSCSLHATRRTVNILCG